MHSGSIVQDRRRLYAPMVTYLSIDVSAGSPGTWKIHTKKKLKSEVIVGATCLHFLWSVDLSRVVVALRKWE